MGWQRAGIVGGRPYGPGVAADVYIPTPDDALRFVESLQDPGVWEDSRVTHWHLWRDEIGTGDRERFGRERIHGKATSPAGVAAAPREALRWLVTQQCEAIGRAADPALVARHRGWHSRVDWQERTLVSWHSLTHGWPVPSGFGMQVRDSWSVMIYADPMTPGDCSRSHS